jgi:hypothetical protein
MNLDAIVGISDEVVSRSVTPYWIVVGRKEGAPSISIEDAFFNPLFVQTYID